MGHYYFWGGAMWILPIIGLIVILFIIYMVFGHGGYMGGSDHHHHHHHHDYRHYAKDNRPESAIDILNKRYARGEITKEEFEQMKKDISG